MTDKGTNRYITKSDRLVVYRHPVAREHAVEVLHSIREKWWKIEEKYNKNPSQAGLMMYNLLMSLFGKGDTTIILEDDDFDYLTDYDEKDCLDWWDLVDTQEIIP